MNVSLSGFVLSAHIIVAVIGLMMAAVLHAELLTMRAAHDVEQIRFGARVLHSVEPLLPLAALAMLVTGAWLIHLSGGEFAWSDGWILTSVVVLVAVEAFGAVVKARSRALIDAVEHASRGPISTELHACIMDPLVWTMAHVATASFLGVIFLMTAKPAGGWAVAIAIAVALGGWLSSIPATRQRHEAARRRVSHT